MLKDETKTTRPDTVRTVSAVCSGSMIDRTVTFTMNGRNGRYRKRFLRR